MSEVSDTLRPTHSSKTLSAMKAPRAVKRITFDRSEASPGETLYVRVPKLNENEVFVPGSLALRFDIDLSGGHANNFLVQNVTRAPVGKLVVKFAGAIVQDTVGYDIFKIFEDLFLSQEQRDNMLLEGIHSEDLCKIRSGAGDKKTSGVATENKLNTIYGNKYLIRLDHQILTDHGFFYPQALYNDLVFEVRVTISHNMLYSEGIVSTDLWAEASRFFVKEKNKIEHMNLKLFLARDRFGLLIDLRSMADRTMHGSGTRLVRKHHRRRPAEA